MPLTAKKPIIQRASKREKAWTYMELRGIAEWLQGRLDLYYKPVASVPNAPNFIELLNIDVDKEELLELLISICADYWNEESDLDEALAILQTRIGKKLADRRAELTDKLSAAFDQYMKTKLDEKIQAFKRSTMH